MTSRKTIIRGVLLVVFTASSVPAVGGLTASTPTQLNTIDDSGLDNQLGAKVAPAPPTSNITVITTQGADNKGYSAELLALDGQGRVVYANDTYGVYYDADPVSTGQYDVLYLGSTDWRGEECPNGWKKCTDNRIEIVNLSTGAVERVYSKVTKNHKHSRWHDVDRLNQTHYVVAGIEHDRVFLLNASSGEKTWTWHANESYPGPSKSGGPSDDWTHLNDVEVLPDGRIMISPRNHDQVAFLHRDGTLDRDWTIGADGNHSVMYEQHNPDYIPESEGGPAVVIADSENNRLVEYQREQGEWVQSWAWTDSQLDWPRDADRLPNGHTLVTDSLGDRVLEVNPRGEVVWSVPVGIPYEAERLGTGDESSGGPSAQQAGLWTRTRNGVLPSIVPAKVRHGIIWVLPSGLSFSAAVSSLLTVVSGGMLSVSIWRGRYRRGEEASSASGD